MIIARKRTSGFALVAAVILLVALATLGITVSRLTSAQNTSAAEDAMQAYALQAARAGTEWGLYQALQNASCSGSQTLDLRSLSGGFSVTVGCQVKQRNEGVQSDQSGGTTVRVINIYQIDAIACNSTACPDATKVGQSGYVERRRVATLCATGPREPC